MQRREVAIVVIQRDDGRLLAISRGEKVQDWAVPGGGREAQDATLADAALRELREETGIEAKRVIPVYEETNPNGIRVVAFVPVGIRRWPHRLRSAPFEGYVGWVAPETLTSPAASHAAYAARMLSHLGIQK